MASPLTVIRNDYHNNKKSSDVYTPIALSQYLHDVLSPFGYYSVLDPCTGNGSLLKPWTDAVCIGIDEKPGDGVDKVDNFFWLDFDWKPDLVLCNPPYNHSAKSSGRRLLPEVFLERIFKLFGVSIPVALFTPMGFMLNQRKKSYRYRWLRDCGCEITGRIALPLDIFPDVEFHQEILLFNVQGCKATYILPDKVIHAC